MTTAVALFMALPRPVNAVAWAAGCAGDVVVQALGPKILG